MAFDRDGATSNYLCPRPAQQVVHVLRHDVYLDILDYNCEVEAEDEGNHALGLDQKGVDMAHVILHGEDDLLLECALVPRVFFGPRECLLDLLIGGATEIQGLWNERRQACADN